MQVGNFNVSVHDPYPVWIHLTYRDDHGREISFSHSELCDLEYAIKWAKREAKQKLKAVASGAHYEEEVDV